MWTQLSQPLSSLSSRRAAPICKSLLVAGALAFAAVTTGPSAAYAGNGHGNVGAVVGLGILGGVIAGAAIASTVPPVYGAPGPAYYYPPQGYYPPSYYNAPTPYYGTPYGYYTGYGYQ